MRARLPLLGLLAALLLSGCMTTRAGVVTTGDLADRLSGFIWPLPLPENSSVTSSYGPRGQRHHDGLDLPGRGGDPIYAAGDGKVAFAGWQGGYGQTVIIDHGGDVVTLYAHASTIYVRTGQTVRRGQPVAAIGRTGNATGDHLHFEIRWDGYPIDPVLLLPRMASR